MYCTGSSTVNVQVLPLLKIVVLLERVRLYTFLDQYPIAGKKKSSCMNMDVVSEKVFGCQAYLA